MSSNCTQGRLNGRIAGVQAYFNFLNEPDRLRAALAAREMTLQGDVRVVTVEVVLRGCAPEIPWPDKIVVEVSHPAWYKASAINFGARFLVQQGYEYIAWLDADSYITPLNWGESATQALQHHKIIQLGDMLTEYEGEVANTGPSIAAEIVAGGGLRFRGFDGGGWAARAEFFESVGLWPYSVVEGGNKVLLYPFIKEHMRDHPLLLATRDTSAGASLQEYWGRLETWNGNTPLGVLHNHRMTLLPHGSSEGREGVWAIRYAFYRRLEVARHILLTEEGFPVIADETLRAYLDLILRERSFPSPETVERVRRGRGG